MQCGLTSHQAEQIRTMEVATAHDQRSRHVDEQDHDQDERPPRCRAAPQHES